jgi:hypothetical protein
MPAERTAMRHVREVLRSKFVGGVPTREIARRIGILDDWGLEPLDAAARHDPLEILEERYGRRSTIITSQILSTNGTS